MKLFAQQPWVMISSDGGINNRHPRAAGTFPKVLGRYVRQEKWLELPEAIRKMTQFPAQRLGLPNRGVVRPGAFADLVLFDPNTVIDRSTYAEPATLAEGVRLVMVNGQIVWRDGKVTDARPGRALVHEPAQKGNGKVSAAR